MVTATETSPAVIRPRAAARERWAWYLYDFGNSAYASVILLAVYAAYFKQQVVGGAEGTRLWGLAVGIAMLVVALIAPILGAIADFSASKKRFLFFFTAQACVFTALLIFVDTGRVIEGMVFFILAEIGYRGAQVFYNSLLPEIAQPEEVGWVSGIGWAIGTIGGTLLLVILLPILANIKGTMVIRIAFIVTAAWFMGFAMPAFAWLRERSTPQPLPQGTSYLGIGFRQALQTLRKARHYREFIKFVIAFLIYNDGVMMTLDFAAIIGAVLFGMNQQDLIIFVIAVQITNIFGSYVFGWLADRWSAKKSLLLSIGMMIAAVAWMYFTGTVLGFYLVGALAGFAMAGVQSVSRSMVSVLSPPGQSAEFYGFFAVAGRTSSFIGPAVYGWLAYRMALWYESRGLATLAAEQQGQRIAILSIGLFLLVGAAILLSVNEKKARMANTLIMEPASTPSES
ncbi:MAG: MFS transporter [Anaerolineae bacterium]|nr:MFS transporter [Anaerolineae bacterium]